MFLCKSKKKKNLTNERNAVDSKNKVIIFQNNNDEKYTNHQKVLPFKQNKKKKIF